MHACTPYSEFACCFRLADMGHTVVGVDVSASAMEQFFSDMDLSCTVKPVPECKGSVYKVHTDWTLSDCTVVTAVIKQVCTRKINI